MTATVTLPEIPLDQLRTAEWNARKTFEPAALAELTETIREHGIQTPLLIRPLSVSSWKSPADFEAIERGENLFEIVCGHRRFKAAQDLGLETVPCIIRNLDDAQAREIGLLDNLQREDVPALEEADGYADLQQSLGTPAAIALRVGKPLAYVVQRLKLRELTQHSRDALAARLITLDHALLLAKVGAEEEEEALRWTLDKFVTVKQKTEDVIAKAKESAAKSNGHGYWQPQGVPALRHWIEEHTNLALSRAPWDLEDAQLVPEAGACSACPKNTQANTALFSDLAIGKASCTDAICWNRKRTAFVQIQIEAAKSAGAEAVRLSWKQSTAAPRLDKETGAVKAGQTFKAGQWIEAKKGSCEHVVPGITVDFGEISRWSNEGAGRKPGKKLSVCVTPKCKAHRKAFERVEAHAREHGAGNSNSTEEKAAREKQAELNKAENLIRKRVIGEAIAGVKELKGELLRRIVRLALPGWMDPGLEEMFPGLEKTLETAKPDSVQFARAAASVLFCGDDETYLADSDGYYSAKDGRPQLVKLLQVIGYDASKAWTEKKPAAKKPVISKAVRERIAAAQKKALAKKGGRK